MEPMRLIIAFAALCVAGPAMAHSLWWVKPTLNTDGTAITETVSTLIEWSDGETFGEVAGSRTVTASSATMPDPTSTRCYRVFAVVAGELSDPSNVWCKVIGPPAPKVPSAPTGLSGN